MENNYNFFDILSEENIIEYYDLKEKEKQDDYIYLSLISLLIDKLLKDMKKDNFKEEIVIKINNLIYKFSIILNNPLDKELEEVTEVSLYINKIERKCLKILKKIMKNNFRNDINTNISDIYLCLICLDSIQISINELHNNMLKRNKYYNKFEMCFPYEDDYIKDKEKVDEVYQMVKKMEIQQKN